MVYQSFLTAEPSAFKPLTDWEKVMVMRIMPLEAERIAHAFSATTIDKASQCMRTDGALILDRYRQPGIDFRRQGRSFFKNMIDIWMGENMLTLWPSGRRQAIDDNCRS